MNNRLEKVQALYFHDGEPHLIGLFEGECINETIYAAAVKFMDDDEVELHKKVVDEEKLFVYRRGVIKIDNMCFYIEEQKIHYRGDVNE